MNRPFPGLLIPFLLLMGCPPREEAAQPAAQAAPEQRAPQPKDGDSAPAVPTTTAGGVITTGEPSSTNPRIHRNGEPPAFSCCESAITASQPAAGNVNTKVVRVPGGRILLIVSYGVPVTFKCAAQENQTCVASFQRIEKRQNPSLNGANPVSDQIYWRDATGSCDGNDYRGTVEVLYRAEFGPNAGNSSFAGDLELEVQPPVAKGTNKRITVKFKAAAGANPPTAPAADTTSIAEVPQ